MVYAAALGSQSSCANAHDTGSLLSACIAHTTLKSSVNCHSGSDLLKAECSCNVMS